MELLDTWLKYYDDKPSIEEHQVFNQFKVYISKMELLLTLGQFEEAIAMSNVAKTKFVTVSDDVSRDRKIRLLVIESQCYARQ